MTTSTLIAGDWLQAIDDHPLTTTTALLAAYDLLGSATDLTREVVDESILELTALGFLKVMDISDDGLTYTYEPSVP